MNSTVDLVLTGVSVRQPGPGGRTQTQPGPVAITAGRIVAVGPEAELPAEQEICLPGAVVLPGFVDTHTHLGWAGRSLWRVNAESASSRGDLLAEVARAAGEVRGPHWLLGGHWTAELRDLPTARDLDRVTGDLPCLLVGADQQVAVCNTTAMRLMMLDRLSEPAGGSFGRAPDGSLTGVLHGAATRDRATAGIIPPEDLALTTAQVGTATRLLASRGVTQAHDIATVPGDQGLLYTERSFTDARAFHRLEAAGELPIRIGIRPYLERWAEFAGPAPRPLSRLVDFLGLKLFLGGSGYLSDAGDHILISQSYRYPGVEQAVSWVGDAHRNRLPVSIHALGDGDVAEAVEVFSRALGRAGAQGVPHRVVHARSVAPAQVRAMAVLGLTAEVQPWDVFAAAPRLWPALGPRGRGRLAPLRSLLDEGVALALGSDWRSAAELPAADPLVQAAAAVVRGCPGHAETFGPEQALTAAEALWAATGSGAILAGAGSARGRVAVGQAADLAVLGADPMLVEPAGWPQIPRLLTVVDGRPTWAAPEVELRRMPVAVPGGDR